MAPRLSVYTSILVERQTKLRDKKNLKNYNFDLKASEPCQNTGISSVAYWIICSRMRVKSRAHDLIVNYFNSLPGDILICRSIPMASFLSWCKFLNTPQMLFLSVIIVDWWRRFGPMLTQVMEEMCSTEKPQMLTYFNKQLMTSLLRL